MKLLPVLALGCSLALLTGCQSDDLGDSNHSALAPREAPRTHIFQADTRATYDAARAAAAEMGYRFVKGGPAEGTFTALSNLSDDTAADAAGNSTQITMKVTLSLADPSGTQVSVSFGEILESAQRNEPGMATVTPLRDTPLFEVFFREVQRALTAGPKAADPVSH
jgi:hypothetical protein